MGWKISIKNNGKRQTLGPEGSLRRARTQKGKGLQTVAMKGADPTEEGKAD